MQRIDARLPFPSDLRGGIMALGNFDGFHLGHQAVVARAVAAARAAGRPVLVATFDPHPVRFFQPDASPFRLTSLDQREALFAGAGADAMVVFGFDERLAALTAEQFVAERLVANAGVAGVVTGEDFTFGRARGGNIAVLRDLGAHYDFTVEAVAPVTLDGAAVSSSRIRDLLRGGDPQGAAKLLTRPFAIQGVVQHGDKVGRTLGFPTANLDMDRYVRPRYGIYAVEGHLPGGVTVPGVANLGVRPSFDPPKELLEPYFLDWKGDLYGQTIEVALIAFQRPEEKFDSMAALETQMRADEAEARRLLSV